MRVHRCECGKGEYYESGMPPQNCDGCDSCQTTYGSASNPPKSRVPHDWQLRYNSHTGEQDRRYCKRCYHSEKLKSD